MEVKDTVENLEFNNQVSRVFYIQGVLHWKLDCLRIYSFQRFECSYSFSHAFCAYSIHVVQFVSELLLIAISEPR